MQNVNPVTKYIASGAVLFKHVGLPRSPMPDLKHFATEAVGHWALVLVSFAVAIAAIRGLIPLGRRVGWIDRPNNRKVHEGEVPLIGGWAIVLSMGIALMAVRVDTPPAGYLIGALLLFAVALIDDRYPIRARYRFAVQCAAAVAGLWIGGMALPSLGDLLGSGELDAWWLVVPVSLVGLIAVVNAVNFSDGADGLCGGLAFIALGWFAVSFVLAAHDAAQLDVPPAAYASSMIPLCLSMMGAIGGFLVFNLRTPWRQRAAVFLGDSGSTFLGYTVAWIAVHVASAHGMASVRPVVCLWVVAVPLADAASCMVRRVLAGQTPMTADLKHFHHLLRRFGLSISQSVLMIHALAALCGLMGVAGWRAGLPDAVLFAAFVLWLGLFIVLTNLAWRRLEARGVAIPSTS